MSKFFSWSKGLIVILLVVLYGLAVVILPQREVSQIYESEAAEIEDYFQYRFDQMKAANGEIPDGALMNALNQRAELARQSRTEGTQALSWNALGPGNVGGRIRAILPLSSSTVLIGSVSGGLWKTTNCCSTSTTWTLIDDFMPNLSISSLIVDPNNSNVMYAGTGESFTGGGMRGAGVFKSTDGGTTWTQLANTNDSNWYYVNRLAISPNGATILAATGSGVWRSTDGGSTWSQRLTFSPGFKDVRFDASNNSNAVSSAGYGYVYYSTNGGSNWTAATGLPSLTSSGRVELAYAPSDSSIVYAGVNQNSGDLYKSTDGGHSFTLVNSATDYLGTQGSYDNMLWVSPTDANQVVVGGIDMYQSTDGGTTLTQISDWSKSWYYANPPSPHADHHVMVSIPGSSSAVLNGNDGGIYYTSDISTAGNNLPNYNNGWVYLNNTIGITQFYGVAGNSNGVLYGGSQDNGVTRYTTGGGANGWTYVRGGDGGKAAADPTNSNYFYSEYVYAQISRSTDGGATASYIDRTSGCELTDSRSSSTAPFIAPLVLDPNDSNILYVGAANLWKSANVKAASPCFAIVKPTVTDNKVNAIAVAPGDSNIIWVGYKLNSGGVGTNGRIEMTTNGGSNWTRVDTNISAHPGTQVSSIAIDKNDNNVVYVGFTGFGTNRLWRTTDGGATWASITNNLPEAPVYAVAINPSNSARLYVGTEVGMYVSVNTGGTWGVPPDKATTFAEGTLNGSGPANVATFDLEWMGGGNSTGTTTLIAGTHGRGAFTTSATPTNATLGTFRAKLAKGGAVRLQWTTESELNALGFNIWRANKRDGKYTKLNADLIPAKSGGQVNGNRYHQRDTKVKTGKTYFYKIEMRYSTGDSGWSEIQRIVVP